MTRELRTADAAVHCRSHCGQAEVTVRRKLELMIQYKYIYIRSVTKQGGDAINEDNLQGL